MNVAIKNGRKADIQRKMDNKRFDITSLDSLQLVYNQAILFTCWGGGGVSIWTVSVIVSLEVPCWTSAILVTMSC